MTDTTRRILALAASPEKAHPELDWINSRIAFKRETLEQAVHAIQEFVESGAMVVVREERIP